MRQLRKFSILSFAHGRNNFQTDKIQLDGLCRLIFLGCEKNSKLGMTTKFIVFCYFYVATELRTFQWSSSAFIFCCSASSGSSCTPTSPTVRRSQTEASRPRIRYRGSIVFNGTEWNSLAIRIKAITSTRFFCIPAYSGDCD